jgi:calreticulin
MILVTLFLGCQGEVFFEERFNEGWQTRWVKSEKHPPGKPFGRWQLTAGSTPGDPAIQRGIKTLDQYRHYAISAKFQKMFTNKTSPLLVQYTVKQDRPLVCGGSYIKILQGEIDQKRFTGGSPYAIMFGPDICFAHTHQVKLIISRNGTNFNMNQHVDPYDDGHTHLYSLYFDGNGSFGIFRDGEEKWISSFREEFDYEGPKFIMDPYDRKPADWDDREWVVDAQDARPDDWDDRLLVEDLSAKKPALWNDDVDGEWRPPMMQNPDYKGVWKPREIPNAGYMGVWRPRKIPNPDYSPDDDFGRFSDLNYFAIDVHQDNAGSLFDNMLVTDNWTYGDEVAHEVFYPIVPLENQVYFRWGGHNRWEKQRDWGIMDFGKSKTFGMDANGNRFDNPDVFYQNTRKKVDTSSAPRQIDDKSFSRRDDL